jgi:hypothetical protein
MILNIVIYQSYMLFIIIEGTIFPDNKKYVIQGIQHGLNNGIITR